MPPWNMCTSTVFEQPTERIKEGVLQKKILQKR